MASFWRKPKKLKVFRGLGHWDTKIRYIGHPGPHDCQKSLQQAPKDLLMQPKGPPRPRLWIPKVPQGLALGAFYGPRDLPGPHLGPPKCYKGLPESHFVAERSPHDIILQPKGPPVHHLAAQTFPSTSPNHLTMYVLRCTSYDARPMMGGPAAEAAALR